MAYILGRLISWNIKFEKVDSKCVRVYGNFDGFSVVRESEQENYIEVDGRLIDYENFEDWLYVIKQWNDDWLRKWENNMVRKINNKLYKVNTYFSAHIIEVDDNYDEEVQKLRKEIQFDSIGYKLNLLVYLATLTVQGYAILSGTEFNIDGSKPRVAYASNKDFKKIVKYYFGKKA